MLISFIFCSFYGMRISLLVFFGGWARKRKSHEVVGVFEPKTQNQTLFCTVYSVQRIILMPCFLSLSFFPCRTHSFVVGNKAWDNWDQPSTTSGIRNTKSGGEIIIYSFKAFPFSIWFSLIWSAKRKRKKWITGAIYSNQSSLRVGARRCITDSGSNMHARYIHVHMGHFRSAYYTRVKTG